MKPVVICGVSVPVRIAAEEDEPDLEGRFACFDPVRGEILIGEGAFQDVRLHDFLHEFAHGCNRFMSVEVNLRRLGLTHKQAEAVEEYIAELFPQQVDNLERNGWFKRPIVR